MLPKIQRVAGFFCALLLLGTQAVAAGPPNDSFGNRIVLTGSAVTATGSNVGAGMEPGEPNHAGLFGTNSAWWTWTAPTTGSVIISTLGSGFDTVLAVYTGSAVNVLTQVAANDQDPTLALNTNGTSRVSFNVTGGTAYQIAVVGFSPAAGFPPASGNIVLTIRPDNNHFANRITFSGTNTTVTGSNVGATKEAGEPDHAGSRHHQFRLVAMDGDHQCQRDLEHRRQRLRHRARRLHRFGGGEFDGGGEQR